MKALWTGSISFGLVEIPIKIVSAIEAHVFGFRILHEKCHTPLEYERWCPRCKKEVNWENTLKGYEQEDGSFRVFTKEELESLKPEKTDRIEVLAFIPHDQLHDIYQSNHYYVLPSKAKNKSYFLFQRALQASELICIGRFVMREKEYLCSIAVFGKGLLLNTLNYSYEIRSLSDATELRLPPVLSKDEIRLAEQLIAQMTKKHFDVTHYKDTFVEQLKKELKSKKKPGAKAVAKSRTKPKKEEDLVSMLRTSLRKPTRQQPVAYASPAATKRKKAKKR